MAATQQRQFLGHITIFQERRLPEMAIPAGYSALIDAYSLAVPLPRTLAAIGARHRIIQANDWRIMTPRHAPPATLDGHLTFALKYEGLDLAVLKRLFLVTGPGVIEDLVREKPTGSYARRIWFLYEWLTDTKLNLPDAEAGRYVPVLDPDLQWAGEGVNAPRYRLKNNLPGTPELNRAARPFHRSRPAATRTGHHRQCATRSAGPHSGIFTAQRLPFKLRH